MAQKPPRSKPLADGAGPEEPYCRFVDDRERRNALVSRDIRIFGCRLAWVIGLVVVALYGPTGNAIGVVLRLLGRG